MMKKAISILMICVMPVTISPVVAAEDTSAKVGLFPYMDMNEGADAQKRMGDL